MRTLLAIDPATTTGYALVDEHGRVLQYGHFTVGADGVRPLRVIIKDAALVLGLELTLIEDAWLGQNPATAIFMARLIGRYQEACEGQGVRVRTVKPSEWRESFFKQRNGKARMKRPELKRAAVDTVKRLMPMSAPTPDEAEAILIGIWAAGKLRMGGFSDATKKLPVRRSKRRGAIPTPAN